MKLTKQELKYQAQQQLQAKFRCQSVSFWDRCATRIDITQLLKKVIK